jgi:hypothetical protein
VTVRFNRYNDSSIGALFDQTAQALAPPSPSDLNAYADTALKRQKFQTVSQLLANPNDPKFDRRNIVLGTYAPTQSFQALNMDDATKRRGQDVTAATDITNNQNTVRGSAISSLFGALNQGQVRPDVPAGVASTIGLPQMPAVAGAPKPLSETEWQAGQNQRLLDAGKINDQTLVDAVMGKDTPVHAVGPDGQPIFMSPGAAVRTSAQVAPTPPSTIIQNKAETAYDATEGAANAQTDIAIQKDASGAQGTLNTVGVMRMLMADPNYYSGPAATQIQAAKQIGATLGLTVPDAASPMEAFNALSNQLVIDAAGGSLGNQISNGDVKFLTGSKPNLDNTQAGNKLLLDITEKLAQRKQQVAQWAADYKAKNNGRLDGGWTAYEKTQAEANPLFPTPPAGEAGGPTGGDVAQPQTDADYNALPSGALFIDPQDGKTYRKP